MDLSESSAYSKANLSGTVIVVTNMLMGIVEIIVLPKWMTMLFTMIMILNMIMGMILMLMMRLNEPLPDEYDNMYGDPDSGNDKCIVYD